MEDAGGGRKAALRSRGLKSLTSKGASHFRSACGTPARMTSPVVRVLSPQRVGQQVVFTISEDSLSPEHPARLFWTAFGTVDLSPFHLDAKAVEGRPGRDRLDPRMLLTLWAFALWDGVVCAREIERRTERDIPYRWIVGDLSVSRAKLSEFLAHNRDAIVEVLCDVTTSLLHAGLLLPSQHITQDGMKVMANASSGSFRTETTLMQCREQAALHLKATLARMDEPPVSERSQRARERHAREFQQRIEQASQVARELTAAREATRKPSEPFP